jgi:hypothetical protein
MLPFVLNQGSAGASLPQEQTAVATPEQVRDWKQQMSTRDSVLAASKPAAVSQLFPDTTPKGK